MYGREYLEYLAAQKLIAAVRDAADAMEPEYLAAHLEFQARQARHLTSGDTCYLGRWPGEGWL